MGPLGEVGNRGLRQWGHWIALEMRRAGNGWATGDGSPALQTVSTFLQAPNGPHSPGTLALPRAETREELALPWPTRCCCQGPRFPHGPLGPSLQSCPWTVGENASHHSIVTAPAPAVAGNQPLFPRDPCPQAVSLQCPHPRHRPLLPPGRMWPFRGDPMK